MRRLSFAVVAFASLAAALGFACSLDLDESLIGKADGGRPVPEGGTSGSLDPDAEGPVAPPGAIACATDAECVTTNGCLKGRCDLARKACSFDVCRPAACMAGKCDEAAKTCGAPAAYKARAGSFQTTNPIYSGIVAAYPWLFVGTQAGVIVYNASNPTTETPVQVPLTGIGFVPTRLLRSGNRIWMTFNPFGPTGAQSRLSVAYVDVPSDPFTTQLRATTVLVSYSRSANEDLRIYARDGKSILLVTNSAPTAAIPIETTVSDGSLIAATPFTAPADTESAATSGTRLVMMSRAPGVPSINFISNAGATTATNDPAIALTDLGPTGVFRYNGWASNVDGTLFFAATAEIPLPGAPDPVPTVTRAVKAFFLANDGKAALTAAAKGVDLEVYAVDTPPGQNADFVRAPVLIDSNTAMVAVAAAGAPGTQTAVQFVSRDPLAVKTDRRVVLDVPVGAVAASSASNGIGYLATNETVISADGDAAGNKVIGRIYAFDPACVP